MATFVATTASNGPRLSDPEAVQQVLDRYYMEGDITASIERDEATGQSCLAIYGYDWPGAWKIPHDVPPAEFEPDYDIEPSDGFEDFLCDIAPYLAEPLTVQAVGAEKCRFPLSACEWHIQPGGTEVEVIGFLHSDIDSDPEPVEPAATPALKPAITRVETACTPPTTNDRALNPEQEKER